MSSAKIEPLNRLQRETWTAGDFPKMGVELAIAGELLCESVPVLAGDRVLDVATASGNTALAAARRRAVVTGVDITPALLERAKLRAAAEGLEVDFQHGDATALAFEDHAFDVVMSTFGAIFAPDPEKTAAEMARVCRPGGKIAMANWTPDGMLGKLFLLLARYSPQEDPVKLPISWGDEAVLKKRLGPYTRDLRIERQAIRFRSPSPSHWVEFMKIYFGPAIRAFHHSPPETQKTLTKEMTDLISEFSNSPNGTVLSESEYLNVVATRNDRSA
ncbi:MAG TPA: class I SAM-dependent methyltransferase [Bryobacteraceae bacterium]|jgi:ubiquinone/menaquinone biosynthesis C-methylase UbiE